MNYFGTSINTASVVAETAGAVIENGAFCAVKYDENGDVMLCDTTAEKINADDDVTMQIKDIGYCKAGAEIKKGQEVMVDTQGRVIPVTAGKFVMGYAMTNATAENEIIEVDIRKCGYKA